MSAAVAFAAGALTTAVATPLLARAAHALAVVDDPAAAPARKLQAAGVPPVGGPALLAGLVAARLAGGSPLPTWLATTPASEAWWWAALCIALATGLVDDVLPRGLRPARKLVGQVAAGIAFALAAAPVAAPLPAGVLGGELAAVVVLAALAVLAQNLLNTWDNADGAATTSGLAGVAPGATAGALAAFLPFNLFLRRFPQRGEGGVPRAYLGDSGSHVVALVVLAAPWGWPALVPCALDLARTVVARVRAGDPPWRGDRRHLAHRLQEAGLGPRAVALVLFLVTLPGVAPGWLRLARGEVPALDGWQAAGLAGVLAAFSLCVAWTLEPVRAGGGAPR